MIYLSTFHFPTEEAEWLFFAGFRRTCYDSFYPFQIFPQRGLHALDLADITILYGGNGSGKTTALNVMAETLRLHRGAPFNGTSFFKPYCQLCSPHLLHPLPPESCILTSDDVFDTMLDMRAINEGVDRRRDELLAEAKDARNAKFQLRSLEDYDRLKQVAEARRSSQSQYARRRVMPNVRTHSNGESAFLFLPRKSAAERCICWTSRKTAFRPGGRWNWPNSCRNPPGSTTVSSCLPPTPLSSGHAGGPGL